MDEHRRSFIRAVLQKSHNARIIQILRPNVISNLYTQVSGLHASAEFPAGRVDILQRHLAK
jgi:hypothetical protein